MDRTIERTSETQRVQLAVLGFARVDGLKATDPIQPSSEYEIKAVVDQLGRWDANNGRLVVVTEGGEVWLAFHPGTENFWQKLKAVTDELCPRGQGAFVPCSNGEALSWYDTMQRLSNPDWQPRT